LLDLRQALTAKVGGTAAEVHDPATLEEIVVTLDRLRSRGRNPRILGGGSNIVALEGELAAPIVRVGALRGIVHQSETLWQVEAGVQLGRLVWDSARRGLCGLECCAGVPGTVGAAIRINAGGRWGTISSVLREVTVLTADGRSEARSVTPADFLYRKSPFWDAVVLSARLEFTPAERAAPIPPMPAHLVRPLDRIAEVMRHKKTTQPLDLPSAGCIFRNPSVEHPAGRLIDRAGLKGTRAGGAMVSPVHANYIVNTGGATGADFVALIDRVRTRVRDCFGIDLELEVEVWS
jgi:UDP-N-acetylmuramate dehydrogenase